ncbi:MAG: glycosyltransferase [Gemmatimonadota bacterium]|nr:glycosyltransferase [Gemmatimonadota bacterium]MDE3006688.1 glycosyltransferase [Gemmatimonadota bacterium]MDE3014259.1 glycosyltransferase [Gemmatimonadota bacterium]
MSRVLINGLQAKTGGGRSILHNYLRLLAGSRRVHEYFVLTPDRDEYLNYGRPGLEILQVPAFYGRNAAFLFLYFWALPRLLKAHRIEGVLNFGDVPIPTELPQVQLFDWPYAAEPESPAWRRMRRKDRLARRIKLSAYRRFVKHVDLTMAQTARIGRRLQDLYGIRTVKVVPNAVSFESTSTRAELSFPLPEGRRLFLCLSHYYAHKNLEVLVDVAALARARNSGTTILLTIAADQDPAAAALLERIQREGLGKEIVNLGPVSHADVPSLIQRCDGIVMPTLLESFSGVYVEAMYHGCPILTSDLPFAHDVCGEAAWYVDPLDPVAIHDKMEGMGRAPELLRERVATGRDIVSAMPDWPAVFAMIQEHVDTALTGDDGRSEPRP